MITTISVRDAQKYIDDGWDVLAIIRNPGKFSDYIARTPGIYHVPVLSPSAELTARAKELRDSGQMIQETFDRQIAAPFIRQIVDDAEARSMLNRIYTASKNGRKIALACFCGNPDTCHRSVVAGLLQAVGCETVGIKEYSPYMFEFLMLEHQKEKA